MRADVVHVARLWVIGAAAARERAAAHQLLEPQPVELGADVADDRVRGVAAELVSQPLPLIDLSLDVVALPAVHVRNATLTAPGQRPAVCRVAYQERFASACCKDARLTGRIGRASVRAMNLGDFFVRNPGETLPGSDRLVPRRSRNERS